MPTASLYVPRMVLLFLVTCGLLALPAVAQQTFTVTTTADSGDGSLREAITQANATPETDQITFSIAGGGSYAEIFLTSNIIITAPVEIDANTQGCDLSEGLCVRLDGGGTVGGLRLFTGSDGSTVRGLVFTRFGAPTIFGAIEVLSSDNVIVGNYFGTDRTGLVTDPDGTPGSGDELGNVSSGIVVKDNLDGTTFTVTNNRIGGSADGEANVFGGGGESGIVMVGGGTSENRVQGNFIGVGPDGATLLGHGLHGFSIFNGANGNLFGGLGEGEGNIILGSQQLGVLLSTDAANNTVAGNVISANEGGGVILQRNASGNTIIGNRIGTNADGTAALPNGTPAGLASFDGFGIHLLGGAHGNTIVDNQISGNLLAGIILGGFVPGDITDNMIMGNLIGLDAVGQQAVPNGVPGIVESGGGIVLIGHGPEVRGNQIGTPEAPNYIGGNTTAGLLLEGAGVAANRIHSNAIGLAVDGETSVPNGQVGALIRVAAHGNQLGSANPGEANTIVFNPLSIVLAADAGLGNHVTHNLFGGAAFDIDLGLDGPTANDAGDPDDGPNRMQNYADLSDVRVSGDVLTVTFQVDTAPENATYPLHLQLYAAKDMGGATVLAHLSASVPYEAADAQASVTRQITLSAEDTALNLQQLRAAVFDADGNASELSLIPVTVAAEDAPEVPQEMVLAQNYPNPFNPETRIAYALPRQAHVRLAVFDVLGRQVALLVDGAQPAGTHEVRLEGRGLPSGTYLYRLRAGEAEQQRLMVLMK